MTSRFLTWLLSLTQLSGKKVGKLSYLLANLGEWDLKITCQAKLYLPASGFSLGILKHASGTPCLAQFGVPE